MVILIYYSVIIPCYCYILSHTVLVSVLVGVGHSIIIFVALNSIDEYNEKKNHQEGYGKKVFVEITSPPEM